MFAIYGYLILLIGFNNSATVTPPYGLLPWQQKVITNVIALEKEVAAAENASYMSDKLKINKKIRFTLMNLWETTGHCLFAAYLPNPNTKDFAKIRLVYLKLIVNNPITDVNTLKLEGLKKILSAKHLENPNVLSLYASFLLIKCDPVFRKDNKLQEISLSRCMTNFIVIEKSKSDDILKFKKAAEFISSEMIFNNKTKNYIFPKTILLLEIY